MGLSIFRSLAGLVALVAVIAIIGGSGCAAPDDAEADTRVSGDTAAVQYVTTIHPFKAILDSLADGRASVSTLLRSGDSPHTYSPRPSDVARVEASTALLYGAEHLDEWAADLPAPASIELLGMVPPTYRLPAPTGREEAEGAAPSEPSGITDAHSVDPHFWTDPMAVKAMLPALADTLCALDQAGCTTYRANADAFATQLDQLDIELRTMLAGARETPVMLAQPFFRYFMNRYGPALQGVVEVYPGREPSPRDIQAYARLALDKNVAAIYRLPQLPAPAAEAVAEAVGIPVHELDPIGGQAGRSAYGDLLRYNARTIVRTLQ